MVINISFIEKNINFFNCKNKKVLENIKPFFSTSEVFDIEKNISVESALLKEEFSSKESKIEENVELDESNKKENDNVLNGVKLNQEIDETIQNETIQESNTEKSSNEKLLFEENDSKVQENIFSIGEKNVDMNLDEFVKAISNDKENFSPQLASAIKSEGKNLILPDELVTFDCISLPALKPWKINEALKLRMRVDYKNISYYNFSYKTVSKSPQMSVYAIQFVNQKFVSNILNILKKFGIKIKNVNFYSACLSNFYSSNVVLSKFGSIVAKIEKNHTTILSIFHGFLIATFSLACGYEDILANSFYRQDEFSKKMISYKYICYELSSKASEDAKKQEKVNLSVEQIEKDFPTTKTNLLAPIFQIRNANAKEVVRQKIYEMIEFLKTSDLQIFVDKVIIDTPSQEAFDSLKIQNSARINYSESQIFEKVKKNTVLKIKTNGFLGGLKWKK